MIYRKYFMIILLIHVLFFTTNVASQSQCDKCVPPSISDRYYEYLTRLFNKLPSANVIILKNQLARENISVQCQTPLLRHTNNASDNFILKLLGYLRLPLCNKDISLLYKSQNAMWKMWIIGFVCITIINGCAALGFVFRPLMRSKYYNIVMAFMIAMAVGSLTGSAILILIPDSFNLAELYKSTTGHHIDYKWKATVVFGGVYMFFLVERFLKWIINRQSYNFSKHQHNHHGSINICRQQIIAITNDSNDDEQIDLRNTSTDTSDRQNGTTTHVNNPGDGTIPLAVVKSDKIRKVAPVAWMIIFGDALHNFIDGLSIGAAFSFGIFKGISLSLACMCEELPHELGDFAILLNSGMSIKQALSWNLFSAATCYLGFIVGVVLGEMTTSSTWIFAIAGGMFLYISLVDMMPELNTILEKSENEEIGQLKVFVTQNLGLGFGYGIILIMALFGDRINIE